MIQKGQIVMDVEQLERRFADLQKQIKAESGLNGDWPKVRRWFLGVASTLAATIVFSIAGAGALLWRQSGVMQSELRHLSTAVGHNSSRLESNAELIEREMGKSFTEMSRTKGMYVTEGRPRLESIDSRVGLLERVLPEVLATLKAIESRLEKSKG